MNDRGDSPNVWLPALRWDVAMICGLLLGCAMQSDAREIHQDEPQAALVLPRGPYYLGQELRGWVECTGCVADQARLEMPRRWDGLEWIETRPIGNGSRSLSGSGTSPRAGWQITWIVRRTGKLRLPELKVVCGERVYRTEPRVLESIPLPLDGQPAGFLGGVGTLALQSERIQDPVPLGEAIAWRITLSGPGARGSTRALNLDGRADTGWRIESETNIWDPAKLTRTITLTLRPREAGTWRLPEVAVASFDPVLRRFITRRTPKQTLRVVAPAPPAVAFPAEVRPRAEATRDRARVDLLWNRAVVLSSVIAILLGVVVAAWWSMRLVQRQRGRPIPSARRLLNRYAPGLRTTDRELAESIATIWRMWLAQRGAGPAGEATPSEVAHSVMASTGQAELSQDVATLLSWCDRVRFGTGISPGESPADAWNQHQRLLLDVASRWRV